MEIFVQNVEFLKTILNFVSIKKPLMKFTAKIVGTWQFKY